MAALQQRIDMEKVAEGTDGTQEDGGTASKENDN